MELKNRVIAAAMAIGVTNLGVEGETEQIVSYYRDLAKGGVSAVIIGALSSSFILKDEDLGQFIPPEAYIGALKQVTDEVHKYGAKFGVQLMSTNQYPLGANNPAIPGQEWVASSDVSKDAINLWYTPQERLRALTEETALRMNYVIRQN
jgi:2,4-dienoyl-CoA reductase-like NADH-dependent reductase (Old Yellow Enzyme family)